MKRVDFSPERAVPITDYDSVGASKVPLGDGSGEAHARGSDHGMTAVMIQVGDLEPRVGRGEQGPRAAEPGASREPRSRGTPGHQPSLSGA